MMFFILSRSHIAMATLSPAVADPLYTRPQAAEYLGLKVNTLAVWALTRRQALPFLKIGRNVRYKKSALDSFLASCERNCVDTAE